MAKTWELSYVYQLMDEQKTVIPIKCHYIQQLTGTNKKQSIQETARMTCKKNTEQNKTKQKTPLQPPP